MWKLKLSKTYQFILLYGFLFFGSWWGSLQCSAQFPQKKDTPLSAIDVGGRRCGLIRCAMKIKGTIGAKKLSIESSRQSWHDGYNQKSFANQQTCHKQNTNMQDKQARQASERTEIAAVHWSRERRPEHRTRNGTGTERERTGTRTREMLVQHLRHSRLPSAFLAAGKNADGNARGRTICILSRPQNANEIFVKTVT